MATERKELFQIFRVFPQNIITLDINVSFYIYWVSRAHHIKHLWNYNKLQVVLS